MKLGEALYKAQQAEQAGAGAVRPVVARASGGAAGGGGSDKVVDADFEEVDDQKKRGSALSPHRRDGDRMRLPRRVFRRGKPLWQAL